MLLKGFKVILFALLAALLVSLLINCFVYSPHFWWSLIYFTLLYTIINIVFNYRTSPQSSSELLLGTIAIKLLVLFFGVLGFWYFDKAGLFNFSVHFISHYILFTLFEMRYLLSVIKNKYQNNGPAQSTGQ